MTTLPDPDYNYIGVEFTNALWEDVCRCCIFPPDAAYRDTENECVDAEENPIPTPEGQDGHLITILWRMDEPEDRLQRRPRLCAILAAFAHLYSRRVNRRDWLQLVMVRYTATPPFSNELPPVNFRLWNTCFMLSGGSFMFRHVEGREYEKTLPPALPPCPTEACAAAESEWLALVATKLEFLLGVIRDATSYTMLKTELDEWFLYLYQLADFSGERGGYGEAVLEERIKRLRFMPWYPEVLRRMPGLDSR